MQTNNFTLPTLPFDAILAKASRIPVSEQQDQTTCVRMLVMMIIFTITCLPTAAGATNTLVYLHTPVSGRL